MGYCSMAQSGSVQETWKTVEANRELVEASGSCGRHWEAVEDMWETRKGSEGVREVRKAMGKCRRDGKAWEVMVRYTYYNHIISFVPIVHSTELGPELSKENMEWKS